MDIIEQIKAIDSLRYLDALAVDYFHGVNNGVFFYDREIELAFRQREIELTNMEESAKDAAPPLRNHMSETKTEPFVDNTVAFDLTRRKVKVAPPTAITKAKQANIKCDCPIKYGVPCIHKTQFDGVTPDDYHECDTCGCDHKYDPRMAKEVHAKLGETI
jgi:hypothetical protein